MGLVELPVEKSRKAFGRRDARPRTKGNNRLLRVQVETIEKTLNLGLSPEQRKRPKGCFPEIIDAIAEELGEDGSIIENTKRIEKHLKLENSSEDSLDGRLDAIREILSENTPVEDALKDIGDLVDVALMASDADLRKRIEELRFQLARIDVSSVKSIYQEAYSFVACA